MIDINKLIEYNKKTTINGILMPTIDDFNNKTSLAIELWPQINNSKVEYLFGKGVGVELALQGEVIGREKNMDSIPYRSHSDFEIYNSISNNYEQLDNSKDFRQVFGAQEIYPKTNTKALKDMPSDLMDNTYETVTYNGKKYLIPQLELLFLDKYLRKENTPRNGEYDAELLLKAYKLDLDTILRYYELFVKIPSIKKYDDDCINLYDNQYNALTGKIIYYVESLLEEDDIPLSFDNITQLVNDIINENKKSNVSTAYGINFNICPSSIKYIITEDYRIDLSIETQEEIKRLIIEDRNRKIYSYDVEMTNIQSLYESIYNNKTK